MVDRPRCRRLLRRPASGLDTSTPRHSARVSQLVPSRDTTAAAWIVADVQTFAESVLSLVPSRFPAYVRVFHPAGRLVDGDQLPVRWAKIAAANGTRASAGMQLYALTRGIEYECDPQPGVYDVAPQEGSLPSELVQPLVEVLARHTATPERCWFAVWNGFGAMREDIRSAPTFHLPARDYHLLLGPLPAVAEGALDPPWYQSPNLWWPDDHAWCVATEIDLNTTYVGCAGPCRDEILAVSQLKAISIAPTSGINRYSDQLNSVREE
jgi:hypothetical protein